MNILICYASTEGQTRKIARFCAGKLLELGHSSELIAAQDAGDMDMSGFDAAILAGSVHLGKLQGALADFARAHAADLNARKTLLLQVSLAAAGKDRGDQAELTRIAADFCAAAGWTPGAVHQIAGAFRFTQYDFFRALAMRYIAAQYGQKVDPHKDSEYTDWPALAALIEAWAEGGA